jgi:hypothetical protein
MPYHATVTPIQWDRRAVKLRNEVGCDWNWKCLDSSVGASCLETMRRKERRQTEKRGT